MEVLLYVKPQGERFVAKGMDVAFLNKGGFMIGGISNVSSGLASIYNANNRALNDTLSRIASGKRIQKPSDDIVGYFKSRALLTDVAGYEVVKQNLQEAKGYADYALETGTAIMEKLLKSKELEAQHIAADAAGKAEILAEHAILEAELTSLIANAQYNSAPIHANGSLIEVELDPDAASGSLDVAFVTADDIVVPGNLNVAQGTFVLVNLEIVKAASYIAKASGFAEDLQMHMDLTDTIINSKEAAASAITDIDEVKELAASTDLQIRQQASIAMMSQANMSRQGIMQLYM